MTEARVAMIIDVPIRIVHDFLIAHSENSSLEPFMKEFISESLPDWHLDKEEENKVIFRAKKGMTHGSLCYTLEEKAKARTRVEILYEQVFAPKLGISMQMQKSVSQLIALEYGYNSIARISC